MMLRSLVLATTTVFALGATACSGSAPPPAQGAMQIHVSTATDNPPPNTKCTVPPHNAQIGTTAPDATNPGTRVQDGNSGARVQCTVKGSSTFSITGSMRKSTVFFQINGTVPKSGSGTALITSFDPTSGLTMNSPSDKPCTVTPIEIAGGRIWASYKCPGFVDTDSPSTYCEASGYFVFENCQQ